MPISACSGLWSFPPFSDEGHDPEQVQSLVAVNRCDLVLGFKRGLCLTKPTASCTPITGTRDSGSGRKDGTQFSGSIDSYLRSGHHGNITGNMSLVRELEGSQLYKHFVVPTIPVTSADERTSDQSDPSTNSTVQSQAPLRLVMT